MGTDIGLRRMKLTWLCKMLSGSNGTGCSRLNAGLNGLMFSATQESRRKMISKALTEVPTRSIPRKYGRRLWRNMTNFVKRKTKKHYPELWRMYSGRMTRAHSANKLNK